jgi:hypothetical protein
MKSTSFWERFGEELRDQDPASRAISEELLRERVWKKVRCSTKLRLLNLTDPGTLRAIGADGATFFAPYEFTQKWAGAFMDHPILIDGLVYGSRLNTPKKCVALFKRAATTALIKVDVVKPVPIDDPEVLGILIREQITLV